MVTVMFHPLSTRRCLTSTRFPLIFYFQFIAVSLKDGMFNNANVLYKTRFVDGVSTVTRYVQHHKSTSSTSSANKENEATNAKKKQTAKRARLGDLQT